jgi:hypothetical protein
MYQLQLLEVINLKVSSFRIHKIAVYEDLMHLLEKSYGHKIYFIVTKVTPEGLSSQSNSAG